MVGCGVEKSCRDYVSRCADSEGWQLAAGRAPAPWSGRGVVHDKT
jgi:hypothetical protein